MLCLQCRSSKLVGQVNINRHYQHNIITADNRSSAMPFEHAQKRLRSNTNEMGGGAQMTL